MSRRLRTILLCLAIFLIPLTVAAGGYANDTVIVPVGEVIEDNFVRAGKIVEINGDIQGDLAVAGQTIIVNGTVAGDVLAAGQTIEIHGNVAGNVRAAGGDVTINGVVGKNVTVFASKIALTENASIGWSVQAFGSTLDLRGTVIGNLNFYGSGSTIRGDVQGNANLQLGEKGTLRVAAPAVLKKNLEYQSSVEAVIDDAVTIGGTLRRTEPVAYDQEFRAALNSFISFWRLASLFGLLVVGLVFLAVFPKTAVRITDRMRSDAARSIGWGAVLAILIPIVTIILFMTIIGLPLGMMLLVFYCIGMYLTRILAGFWLGQWLLGSIAKGKKIPHLWSMILGVVILSLIAMVPYIGWLVSVVTGVWALGALALTKRDNVRMTEKA